MPLAINLLADMQRFGRLGALAPKAINLALSFTPTQRLARKSSGIHPRRQLPRLPDESFFGWARRNRLDRKPQGKAKVAYFAGCTAGYLFPQVARAAVAVLQRSGVSVFVPPQQCCGMGGSLGFKKEFYDASLRLATPLIRKIQAAVPEAIITDCLSCRLQFQHLLPFPVMHPMEVLATALQEADKGKENE